MNEKYEMGSNRRGLTDSEAERSREKHGKNLMKKAKRKSFAARFFGNMKDPVIRILLCALAVNVIFVFRDGDITETIGIAASVLLATLISTLSEHGSAAAFERLSEESAAKTCRARRRNEKTGAGEIRELNVGELAVGDVVLLSAGERIPADGIMICGKIGVDQSGLTGESKEMSKYPSGGFREDTGAAGCVFGGCTVVSGEGEMEVCRVGDNSFLGRISGEIQTETRESPLKIRLSKLARQISTFGYIAAALCALAYLFYSFVVESGFSQSEILLRLSDKKWLLSELLHAFTLGLTVVVMAVPEGLPMMIAVVLSSNIKRMVRDNVLVRRAVGIEAAGSLNILFTDKTGTLTEGRMTVGGIITGRGEKTDLFAAEKRYPRLAEIYKLSAFFGECEISEERIVGGNLTERALAESVKGRARPEGWRALSRIPFDSKRKYSAIRLGGKGEMTVIKGAPEVILPHVTAFVSEDGKTEKARGSELEKCFSEYSSDGWRMLAIAIGKGDAKSPEGFGELTFVCGVMIADKPRREAYRSVSTLRDAGIQVVMITGDNKDTALAVAKKCGICRGERDKCLESREMSRMSDRELLEILPDLRVVARALPTDKSRLVRLAQERGLVVGMTGDGVNDAPALKAADVGFSMGSGTQVAKDAGDVMILDDNLASIVKAVLYGRNIFKSIRKFIVLQLTVNLCAVGVTMIGPFIGIESPVTVVQMLWINIIMDTLGGLAFAGEPALERYMKEKPKKRDEAILNGYMVNQIALLGAFTVAMCIAFLRSPLVTVRFDGGFGGEKHLTAFFAFFIFAGVFNCFNARTDSLDMFRGLGRNRAFIFIMMAVLTIQIAFVYLGGGVLRTVPLSAGELWYTMSLALLVFPADIIRKIFLRLSGKRRGY